MEKTRSEDEGLVFTKKKQFKYLNCFETFWKITLALVLSFYLSA